VPAPAGSQVLFDAIGSRLRQQRENLSLSLDEIERHTHVRRRHLELLEAGEFAQLPSSVQARGMLQNYSRFLDMDVDALLLKFADGLQALLAERQPKPEVEAGRQKRPAFRFALPPALRRVLTPDLLVGSGVLLLLVLFAIWGTTRIVQQNAAVTPQPTAPSISNILLSTPVPGESTPTGTPAAGTAPPATSSAPTLEIKLPPAGEGPVQVVLVAVRSAWVKVLVDFEVAFEGRATPGTAYAFDAETQIEVISGDGSALSIIYNQSDMGAMGAYGELVDRIYTATTILIPTATFTPTASVTPTPTRTLRPSATTRPTNTQVPPATLVP
jgi:cytoskeletal protein RodZ